MANNAQTQKTLREVLASDGDLRRKAQGAAVQAWYSVIKEAGYSFTALDAEETKADLTAISIGLSGTDPLAKDDDLPAIIIATGIGAAVAAGGF